MKMGIIRLESLGGMVVVCNIIFEPVFVVELWWITSFPNVTPERGDASFPNVISERVDT